MSIMWGQDPNQNRAKPIFSGGSQQVAGIPVATTTLLGSIMEMLGSGGPSGDSKGGGAQDLQGSSGGVATPMESASSPTLGGSGGLSTDLKPIGGSGAGASPPDVMGGNGGGNGGSHEEGSGAGDLSMTNTFQQGAAPTPGGGSTAKSVFEAAQGIAGGIGGGGTGGTTGGGAQPLFGAGGGGGATTGAGPSTIGQGTYGQPPVAMDPGGPPGGPSVLKQIVQLATKVASMAGGG